MSTVEFVSGVASFLNASWKFGAALLLAATLMFAGHYWGLQPLDAVQLGWAFVIGCVGTAFLSVHVGSALGPVLYRAGGWLLRPFARYRRKRLGLRNLEAITEQDLRCLVYIVRSKKRRFKEMRYNTDLYRLYRACLLEHDIGPREVHTDREVHWVIPDFVHAHVSKLIEEGGLRAVEKTPPWRTTAWAA